MATTDQYLTKERAQQLVTDTKRRIAKYSPLPDLTDPAIAAKFSVGEIAQYIGATNANYTHGFFYQCVNDNGTLKWENIPVQPDNTTQHTVMPIPDAGNLNTIIQYTGNTTQNYTQGYFYICTFDGSTYEWTQINVQDAGDSIQVNALPTADATTLGKVLQYIGAIGSGLEHGHFYECVFNDPNYEWIEISVSDEDTIQFSTLPTASAALVGKVYQYVGVTTQDYTHNYWYECVSDGQSTPAYSWERVDVQPNGTGANNIVEGYRNDTDGLFYEEATYTTAITGVANTEYIDIPNNKTYRWDGVAFARLDKGEQIQYATMPTADATTLGNIIQFTGITSGSYKNGYFYKCITDGTNYSWTEVKMPADGVWKGTQTEYELIKDSLPNDTIIYITDKNGESSSGSSSTILNQLIYQSTINHIEQNVPSGLSYYDLIQTTVIYEQGDSKTVTIPPSILLEGHISGYLYYSPHSARYRIEATSDYSIKCTTYDGTELTFIIYGIKF